MNKECLKDIIDELIYEVIVGKNPFKEGDLVKLRPDVLRRHAQSVPAHAGFTKNEFSWRDTLKQLSDKTGKITRVFPNSKHVNVEFSQPWKSKDEYGREYTVNSIGIDYTELLPAEKPDETNVAEGVGYVSDKDMATDPKHIKGERWRIKFQSEDDLKKHGNTEKSSVNEVKGVIKELIQEMWTGFEEGKANEARRDKNYPIGFLVPKKDLEPRNDEGDEVNPDNLDPHHPIAQLFKILKHHPLFSKGIKSGAIKLQNLNKAVDTVKKKKKNLKKK